jgi:hypothetical protein
VGESVINKDDSEYSLVDLLYIYILYITHCINNFSIYILFRQKNIILLIIISYKIKFNIVYRRIFINICECDVNIGVCIYYIIFKNYKDSIYT